MRPYAPSKSYPTGQTPGAPSKSYPTGQTPGCRPSYPTGQDASTPSTAYPTGQTPGAPSKSYPADRPDAGSAIQELSDRPDARGAGQEAISYTGQTPGGADKGYPTGQTPADLWPRLIQNGCWTIGTRQNLSRGAGSYRSVQECLAGCPGSGGKCTGSTGRGSTGRGMPAVHAQLGRLRLPPLPRTTASLRSSAPNPTTSPRRT